MTISDERMDRLHAVLYQQAAYLENLGLLRGSEFEKEEAELLRECAQRLSRLLAENVNWEAKYADLNARWVRAERRWDAARAELTEDSKLLSYVYNCTHVKSQAIVPLTGRLVLQAMLAAESQ